MIYSQLSWLYFPIPASAPQQVTKVKVYTILSGTPQLFTFYYYNFFI